MQVLVQERTAHVLYCKSSPGFQPQPSEAPALPLRSGAFLPSTLFLVPDFIPGDHISSYPHTTGEQIALSPHSGM